MGEKGRVRHRSVEFRFLVAGSQVKTSPSNKPSADINYFCVIIAEHVSLPLDLVRTRAYILSV